MRFPFSPGSESITSLMAFAIGRMMPPERAVTEGIAGAITRSAKPNA